MTRDQETPPPIGRTWMRLYTVVLALLAVEIVIFYAFTKVFE
jgi:hypothetical protein